MPVLFDDTKAIHAEVLTIVIYGPPGVGKTTLALTASAPGVLDFDKGVHRAGFKPGKAKRITRWEQIDEITADDLAGFSTVVLDTVGTCLDQLGVYLRKTDPKAYGKSDLTLKGYGALKGRFSQFLATLQEAGKDIVMVAHSEEQQRGDETVERVVAMGGSRNLIHQSADLIGYLTRQPDKKNKLTFNPSSTTYGKNCHLEDYAVLDPASGQGTALLADIIAQAKANINAEIERGNEEVDRLQALREDLDALEPTAEAFSARMREMRAAGAPVADAQTLLRKGIALGFKYDRESTTFQVPNATAPSPSPEDVSAVLAGPPSPEQPKTAAPEACDYCLRSGQELRDAEDMSGNRQCVDYDACQEEFIRITVPKDRQQPSQ